MSSTIFALSSGRLPSGVAVIRLSGPATIGTLRAMAGFVPVPRRMAYAAIRSAAGEILDRGLVVHFPAPDSFSGEDMAEIQVHGGRAVVAAILSDLAVRPGLRPAEAGEFTRRAFLNGKLDLLEAEALSDLIEAETEAQRRFASANASGVQGELYSAWRTRLIHARALVEAELDFSDEGDVGGTAGDAAVDDLSALMVEIEAHISGYTKAEMIQDGLHVVIIGPPNAGKSTLLNAIARREVAIVSDEPGTTRDLVECVIDLRGFKIKFTDTAGLRAGAGKVEAIGIARAMAAAEGAHLVLDVRDAASGSPAAYGNALNRLTWRVGTKADLIGSEPEAGAFDVLLSAQSGLGIDALLSRIAAMVMALDPGGDVIPSRIRHVQLLRQTMDFIATALAELQSELRAEALRLASDSLGRISGEIGVEDLLDVIFSRFCIGK